MGPIRPVEIMLSQQASYRTMRLLVLLLTGFAALLSSVSAGDDWQTNRHEKGICALYGNAGHRKDGDPLLMPSNQAARPLPSDAYAVLQSSCPQLTAEFGGVNGTYCCDAQQVHDLSTKVQQGLIFLLGCPACAHNFRHFFCTLTCSPEQSLFANVTAVQLAPDTNATAVAEVEYYLTDIFGKRFYESCKDVVFSVANTKAMNFVGGGAKNWTEWAQFLGLVKDKRFPKAGSPFQMDFPGEAATPPSMQAMNESLPACWASALRCSCGDCPDAPSCEPPEPAPAPRQPGCIPGLRSIRCGDLITTALYLALLYVLYRWFKNQSKPSGGLDGLYGEEDGSGDPLLRENSQEFAAVDVQYPYVERCLRRHFKRQGVWCAENPGRTLAACALGVLLLSMGLIRFHVETDPAHLWVGRGSRALQDKQSYEAAFGPFMRIEQLIISTLPSSKTSTLPPIITDANIKLLFDIQERVDNLTAPFQGRSGGNATLKSVCYKPFGDVCATQSLLQYWQMDRALYVSGVPPYHIKLSPEFCFSHWSTQCRADFGGPVDPHVVMGGFPTDSSFVSYTANATSFVVTYPIDSTASNRDAALAWEAAFLKLAATEVRVMAETAGLRVSFSTERSVQDELSRESSADAGTVLLSYLAMLVYIAFALSSLPRRAPLSSLLVYSRLGLGVGGVIIVAASVIAALGVCSAVGMWSTLIIMEVIPFLILAVGVDNLFIISQTLDRQPPSAALPERLGNALAAAGPSITLAAAAETLAFGMAALTPMPAVRNFSAVAAVAVILDYILQVTAFVALLALDARRMEEGRLDIAPCARISSLATTPDQATVPEEDGHYHSLSEYGLPSPDNSLRGGSAAMDSVRGGGASRLGLTQALQWYMANVHAPLLALPVVQVAILALFGGMFLLSAALLPRTSVGLEQQIALPRDSYLQPYFSDVASVLRVGPPLFLVVEDLNMSRSATDVNRICSVSGCDDRSLMNQVSKAAQSPVVSYIASPAASWLDDFLSWISPEVGQCCRSFPEHSSSGHGYCPPADQPPCAGNVSACADCSVCFRSWGGPGPDLLVDSRPSRDQVKERLPWFMEAKPSAECAKGGAGAYTDAIQQDSNGGLAGLEHGIISASAFRTSYVPLAHQADFIEGLKAVTSMVDRVSAELGLRIYSFSVWHVFFEQYLSIARDSVHILGAAAMAVLAACWLLTASLWASLIMLAVIGMILIDMVGAMYLAGIQLNAVSLVNLTMALGIAVEFCAHPVHAFLEARGTRPERSAAALRSAGAAVLSGITVTKFIGVLVLASARTQIFEVYFYRMYLALVLLGAGHGLLLLPVLLALAGPPPFGESHILQDAQEEVQAAADSLPDS